MDKMEEGIVVAWGSGDKVAGCSNGGKAIVARVEERVYGRRDRRGVGSAEEGRRDVCDRQGVIGLGVLHEAEVLGGHVVNGAGQGYIVLLLLLLLQSGLRGRIGSCWRGGQGAVLPCKHEVVVGASSHGNGRRRGHTRRWSRLRRQAGPLSSGGQCLDDVHGPTPPARGLVARGPAWHGGATGRRACMYVLMYTIWNRLGLVGTYAGRLAGVLSWSLSWWRWRWK